MEREKIKESRDSYKHGMRRTRNIKEADTI